MEKSIDSLLLQQLKDGSFTAFEKLYNMYCGKLYNFIMRISKGNDYIAEEIVQQTFIKIWENKKNIDCEKNFISYMCTIAKNALLNLYQHETIEFLYSENITKSSVEDLDDSTVEKLDYHFLKKEIIKLSEELPQSRRKIFVLSKIKGYSNKEIANLMKISESTVSTQLSLAVKYMKEILEKHYGKIVVVFLIYLNL